MNERQERIEWLAARWLEAQTSQAEECELRELLHEGDLPESLRGWALLFEGLEALSEESMPEEAAGRLPGRRGITSSDVVTGCSDGVVVRRCDVPCGTRRRNIRLRQMLLWSAAAAVALGLMLGVELWRRPYCYIDGKPVYDKEEALRAAVYFEAFAALDAPGRMVDQLIENH